MKTLKQFFFHAWRPAILIIAIGLAAYFVFFYKLGSLLPGYTASEINTHQSSARFKDIVAHPLNAPYKVPLYIAEKLNYHSLLTARIIAASFAVLVSILFFITIRRWFSYRVSLLCTILFSTSATLLHSARLGTPLILQMLPLALVALGAWYNTGKRRNLVLICTVLVLCILLYIPGLLWFEILGAIILRKKIYAEFTKLSLSSRILAILGTLLVIAPLMRAFIIFPKQIWLWLGAPENLPSIHTFISNLGHSLLTIGIRSSGSPDLWLGHTPILDVIQIALLLIGLYVYFFKNFGLGRNTFLIISIVIGVILSSLGGPIGIMILMPFIYMLIAGGIYELLQEWLSVFPRNPIARLGGIIVVCTLVSFSVLYQWRSYFIAWPHDRTTKITFDLRS